MLHFSDSTEYAPHIDHGYVVRVEDEGVSVMAAMTEAIGDDKLDTVGPTKVQQRSCSGCRELQ
jgi:hypothetical protein